MLFIFTTEAITHQLISILTIWIWIWIWIFPYTTYCLLQFPIPPLFWTFLSTHILSLSSPLCFSFSFFIVNSGGLFAESQLGRGSPEMASGFAGIPIWVSQRSRREWERERESKICWRRLGERYFGTSVQDLVLL